jgi:signal transduction histidine kinase
MRAIAWLRHNWPEAAWVVFAIANLVLVLASPGWIRPSFDLIWISLAFLYAARLWSVRTAALILTLLSAALIGVILEIGLHGDELWGRIVAIPFLCAIFAAMVWQAQRRKAAVRVVETVAETRATLLERQERFLHDASHELRTPVTIARGHLELLRRDVPDAPEIVVALDELERIEHLVERLLLLAKADQPEFLALADVEIESFLEDVFMRWSEVAPRAWRLEVDVAGVVRADPDALRSALDALLENAVKHTEPRDPITLRAYAGGGEVVIEVADEGCGVPPEARDRIFDRFARADTSRTRAQGGVGLGLSIVDAIAKAHGGRCTVASEERGATFVLRLPVAPQPGPEPGAPAELEVAPA